MKADIKLKDSEVRKFVSLASLLKSKQRMHCLFIACICHRCSHSWCFVYMFVVLFFVLHHRHSRFIFEWTNKNLQFLYQGDTLLHKAASGGDLGICAMLVEKLDADVNAKNNKVLLLYIPNDRSQRFFLDFFRMCRCCMSYLM
jgi:hypothetical protein